MRFDSKKVKCWSPKNELTPRQVHKGTKNKYIFDCDVCGHTFNKSPNKINAKNPKNKRWCPFCSHQKLCDDDCQMCFDNSFASHPKAKCWSADNDLKPRQVFKSSTKEFIFNCNECPHSFKSTLGNITNGYNWCPYHSSPPKKLCDDKKYQMCFDHSFASHPKANCWSDDNDLTSRQVFKSAAKKHILNCDECPHSFKMTPNDVNNDRWCPYHSNPPQRLCDNEDCAHCLANSFKSHPKSVYWSSKNKKSPRKVFKSSDNKHTFDCPYCKKEYISPPNRVCTGAWCSCLKNKTESKLMDFFITNYDLDIEKQKRFKWCRDKQPLPFDFCIEEYKLLIELDGIQHFEQVAKWRALDTIHERDIYKMDCANGEGYSIIRIFQEDVWKDKNNWKIKLQAAIRMYDSPTNICIGDIYKKNPFVCVIDYEDKGGWTDDEKIL